MLLGALLILAQDVTSLEVNTKPILSFSGNTDYPVKALKKNWEGDVQLLLNIDATGKITDCKITQSSGHELLDTAACKEVRRNARFKPATDGQGNPKPSTYPYSVKWRIPLF
jgi:periplasmic protein TonB